MKEIDIYNKGVLLRQQGHFGDAINAFREVIDRVDAALSCASGPASAVSSASADASEALCELKAKASASIELIRSITGFVNKDLMNP